MTNPAVSVVLPVYNCPQYVDEAINSIFAQTFDDFELIVIDDGSTDETPLLLRKYTDRRMTLIRQENRGLAATLNRGIELSKGRYVARQDQDDASFPQRFAKQVAFLDQHPECGIVGTWAEIWRERAMTKRIHRHASDNSTLKFELLFNNPFVHSSVMIRKSALDHIGGYSTDKDRQPPEDYELWSRISRKFDVANIPEVLHRYREVASSMSRDGPAPFLDHLINICTENIAWASGEGPGNSDVVNIAALAHGAQHRIQGKPDFIMMRRILRRAAESVVAPADRIRFARKADRYIHSLRFRYLELRGSAAWLRGLMGIGARAANLIRRAI